MAENYEWKIIIEQFRLTLPIEMQWHSDEQ